MVNKTFDFLGLEAVSNRIPRDLRQYANTYWLVGSQARGDAAERSDVDILIETKCAKPGRLLKKIRRSLAPGDRVDTLATYHKSDRDL
jgi:predicted nucleotidyltransferase